MSSILHQVVRHRIKLASHPSIHADEYMSKHANKHTDLRPAQFFLHKAAVAVSLCQTNQIIACHFEFVFQGVYFLVL